MGSPSRISPRKKAAQGRIGRASGGDGCCCCPRCCCCCCSSTIIMIAYTHTHKHYCCCSRGWIDPCAAILLSSFLPQQHHHATNNSRTERQSLHSLCVCGSLLLCEDKRSPPAMRAGWTRVPSTLSGLCPSGPTHNTHNTLLVYSPLPKTNITILLVSS